MMKKFLLYSTLFLLLGTYSKADPVSKVDMALTVAPYALAIDDNKPFRTAGKVFATQLVATGAYVAAQGKMEAWTLTSTTNAALICNLQQEEFCIAAIAAAGYVIYNRVEKGQGQNAIFGAVIGTASGALVPGIVANF
jgi:hypothetical protein